MSTRALRVCYFGTYRASYSRNQILIEGLRRNGVEVIECHETLWHGIEDRVQAARGGWLRPRFWLRVLRAYACLVRRFFQLEDFDVLVTGYPGQMDVYLARLLSWIKGRPLAWDVFMSIYLVAMERGLGRKTQPLTSRLSLAFLRGLEWLALRLPDCLIQDTSQYVAWFQQVHGVSPERFCLVPTGADDRVFQPLPSPPEESPFRAVYYGTFIPNHGMQYIVQAAKLLRQDADICIELIGDGPERAEAERLAQEYGLQNLVFTGWLDKTALASQIARAHVCLGAFGHTPQSLMTVQNKIYEGLAMARPVVTGDSPAVRQELTHGEDIYVCDRDEPASLAEALRRLKQEPELRAHISVNGYALFRSRFDLQHLGATYAAHLSRVANRHTSL